MKVPYLEVKVELGAGHEHGGERERRPQTAGEAVHEHRRALAMHGEGQRAQPEQVGAVRAAGGRPERAAGVAVAAPWAALQGQVHQHAAQPAARQAVHALSSNTGAGRTAVETERLDSMLSTA